LGHKVDQIVVPPPTSTTVLEQKHSPQHHAPVAVHPLDGGNWDAAAVSAHKHPRWPDLAVVAAARESERRRVATWADPETALWGSTSTSVSVAHPSPPPPPPRPPPRFSAVQTSSILDLGEHRADELRRRASALKARLGAVV